MSRHFLHIIGHTQKCARHIQLLPVSKPRQTQRQYDHQCNQNKWQRRQLSHTFDDAVISYLRHDPSLVILYVYIVYLVLVDRSLLGFRVVGVDIRVTSRSLQLMKCQKSITSVWSIVAGPASDGTCVTQQRDTKYPHTYAAEQIHTHTNKPPPPSNYRYHY